MDADLGVVLASTNQNALQRLSFLSSDERLDAFVNQF